MKLIHFSGIFQGQIFAYGNFLSFLCLSVCGLWSPRPPAPVAAARGSGARGWVAWVGATAGNTGALSGGRGYWAAGGQWAVSTT